MSISFQPLLHWQSMLIDLSQCYQINPLNLFVVLGDHENASNISSIRTKLAIVGVPSVLNRYIELPTKTAQRSFVLIEDVISFFIKSLFNGFNVESVTAFRITRNSDLTVDEEDTEDLLLEMEEVLKARKRGATVRLEIQSTSYKQSSGLFS